MVNSWHLPDCTRHVAPVLLAGIAFLASSRSAAAEDVFTDLGGPIAGISGNPLLQGSGTLQVGVQTGISLSNAKHNSPAALFLSLSSSPVPFKGGMLQAFPFALVLPLTTSPTGTIAIDLTLNSPLPTDFEFWMQIAIQDAAAVHHVAMSNGVKAHVPAPGPAISNFEPVTGSPGTPVTLNGEGLSANAGDVMASVGGLPPFPLSGTATSWTGKLPVIPAPDVLAETISISVGSGHVVLASPAPPFPGIKSSGIGQIWSGSTLQHSFTTSSLFDKTSGPPDQNLLINAYAPNGVEFAGPVIHVAKIHLPLGTAGWGPNAHVAYGFQLIRSDGTSFLISNDQLVPFQGLPQVCAGIIASFITADFGDPMIAAAAQNTFAQSNAVGSDFEITIIPQGSPPVVQVCGFWDVWTG